MVNPSLTSRCDPDSERSWRLSSSAGCKLAPARTASARTAGLGGGSECETPPDAGLPVLKSARGLGRPAARAGRPRCHSLPQGSANPMPAWGAFGCAQAAAPARFASADARRPGRGASAAQPQSSAPPGPGVLGLRTRLTGSPADAAHWLRAVGRGGTACGSGPGSSAGGDGRRPGSGRRGGGAAGADGASGRHADLEERFAGFLARQQACQQACCPRVQ